jgi:hypothetical protein
MDMDMDREMSMDMDVNMDMDMGSDMSTDVDTPMDIVMGMNMEMDMKIDIDKDMDKDTEHGCTLYTYNKVKMHIIVSKKYNFSEIVAINVLPEFRVLFSPEYRGIVHTEQRENESYLRKNSNYRSIAKIHLCGHPISEPDVCTVIDLSLSLLPIAQLRFCDSFTRKRIETFHLLQCTYSYISILVRLSTV